MGHYRVFVLDEKDHIEDPPRIVECGDDQAAITEAKQYLDGRVIEVWSGPRRVVRLDPKSYSKPLSPDEPTDENRE